MDAESFNGHIGRLIRRKRVMLGISQEQLGKLMDVSPQQVQKYESGANGLSAFRLLQILPLIGESMVDFLSALGPEMPEASHLNRNCDKVLKHLIKLSEPEREAITAFAKSLAKSKEKAA